MRHELPTEGAQNEISPVVADLNELTDRYRNCTLTRCDNPATKMITCGDGKAYSCSDQSHIDKLKEIQLNIFNKRNEYEPEGDEEYQEVA